MIKWIVRGDYAGEAVRLVSVAAGLSLWHAHWQCYANSFGMSSNIIAVIRFEPAVSWVATGLLVIVMALAEVDVGVKRVVIMQISSVLVCCADRVLSAADACTWSWK